MQNDLGPIKTKLKTGSEPFEYNSKKLNFNLLGFWQWSVSDLVSNATRGRLAEFIVAKALDIKLSEPRDEWSAYDLTTKEGIKIEVKSSGYVQSWFQAEKSIVKFSIKPSKEWTREENKQARDKKIQADVYVLCLYKPETKENLNPLNLNEWGFYVLSAQEIRDYPRSHHSITLPSLKKTYF
jgi:hypothetical protein